jgi:hypothetical protein
MDMRGMGCALFIRQKKCRKSLGRELYIGARYLPENTVILFGVYLINFNQKPYGGNPTTSDSCSVIDS